MTKSLQHKSFDQGVNHTDQVLRRRILVLGQSARLVGLGLLLGIPTALGASPAIGP